MQGCMQQSMLQVVLCMSSAAVAAGSIRCNMLLCWQLLGSHLLKHPGKRRRCTLVYCCPHSLFPLPNDSGLNPGQLENLSSFSASLSSLFLSLHLYALLAYRLTVVRPHRGEVRCALVQEDVELAIPNKPLPEVSYVCVWL